MNVTFRCSRCEQPRRTDVAEGDRTLACPACDTRIQIPPDAFQDGELRRCLVCPSTDLYVRKDFPQRLGVAIVAFGVIASSIAWAYMLPILTFAILFATALVDVVLYFVMPDALMCYRCHAQYRLAPAIESHGPFQLETHERYRQQAARISAGRSAGDVRPTP